MALNSWTTSRGAFESPEVFSRPPFRSRQYLAATSMVAGVAVLDVGLLVRLRNRVTIEALVYIVLILGMTLATWLRVTFVHKRLHKAYLAAGAKDTSPGTLADLALRAASTLSYFGAVGVAGTGFVGLAALMEVIRHIK